MEGGVGPWSLGIKLIAAAKDAQGRYHQGATTNGYKVPRGLLERVSVTPWLLCRNDRDSHCSRQTLQVLLTWLLKSHFLYVTFCSYLTLLAQQ